MRQLSQGIKQCCWTHRWRRSNGNRGPKLGLEVSQNRLQQKYFELFELCLFNHRFQSRYRIARWLLKSSDELDLSRETALIALIYCDRFMIAQGIVEKRTYQLASIASLFVACKMFEKTPLKLVRIYTELQNRSLTKA